MKKCKYLKIMKLNNLYSSAIIYFLLSLSISAQTSEKDTLSNKSFDELRKIFYHYKSAGQTETGKKVAFFTLQKARKEKNVKAIANSFIRLCRVSYDTPEIALKYTDSCIFYSSKYNLKDIEASGYFYKGLVLFDLGRYSNALESYIEASEYYENQDDEMYHSLRHNIALLKLKVRYHNEALKIFKENLVYENKKATYGKSYLNTLYGLSIAYASNQLLDSSYEINKKAYEQALKLNNSSHLYFTYAQGALHYIKKDFKAAKDSLQKSIPFLEKNKDYSNLAISYFYLGSISNDEMTKIKYYKKVDSIFKFKKYIIPAPRKAYEKLIDYYKDKGDLKNQLHYTERLLVIDTVINREYRNVTHTFHHDYDTPRLVADKEFLILKLSKTNKKSEYRIFILLFALISMLALFILLYKRKKINEKKFLEIIASLKIKSNPIKIDQPKEKKRKSSIDKDTLSQILDGLDEFEEKKVFLTPKLTLDLYAKKLDTNSKYLSIVINDYKFQTFKNYINNLRIKHIVEKLYNDRILRNYTVSAIAVEAGFSSTESFTRAFSKKTGLNVSYFLKKVK